MSDHDLGGEAHIEAHGVPGTLGRLAAPIIRDYDHTALRVGWWLSLEDDESAQEPDTHVAFRTGFSLDARAAVLVRVQASGPFRVWVDGQLTAVGPVRFAPSSPEFLVVELDLAPGEHTVAAHAHGEGLVNRLAAGLPHFLWLDVVADRFPVELSWSCRRLDGFARTGLRTSPLLGWLEWHDGSVDRAWRAGHQPDGWSPAAPVDLSQLLGPAAPMTMHVPGLVDVPARPTGAGRYRDTYTGYRWDDPAVQFLLADRDPDPAADHDGRWLTYDLERVRIGVAELTVTTEEPAEITIAYAERLTPQGGPSPAIALSAGPTRTISHHEVPAGTTRIEPFGTLGARYLEIRVRSAGTVAVDDVVFRQRDGLGEPLHAFHSSDPLLDRIWQVGIDTMRATAEDSAIDSVRERGEWVGDVASSAADLCWTGWGRLDIVKRALIHAAAGARSDGLVAGCGPGELLYLGTYAAQWTSACLNVARLEGDLTFLRELEAVAAANLAAILELVEDDGSHSLPWSFVDWGYSTPRGRPDLSVLCHVVEALTSWITWQSLIHGSAVPEVLRRRDVLRALVATELASDQGAGYHAWVLASRIGAATAEQAARAVVGHLDAGFPFNPGGSRLRDPTRVAADVVTPYFTNYSMPVLLELGQGERAVDYWRRGWGWMLEQGASTWFEVFDDRWSHCHYWSAGPTWQLSRYLLGLHPRLDEGGPALELALSSGGLQHAEGRVALPGGGSAGVAWRRSGNRIRYELDLSEPFRILVGERFYDVDGGLHRVELEPSSGDRYHARPRAWGEGGARWTGP